VMAGPNVIESEEHALKMARQIKSVTDELGLQLVFKSSFDKANRTSSASFRGPGLEYGLKQVKTTYGLPIVTDVHEAYQVSSISSLPHHKSIGFEVCD
jgi:2-dehydro-3-deoxyphosphooctonate aldolase (KDO 8-P synthase)